MYVVEAFIVHGIVRRWSGPANLRLLIQPAIALALGVRDGLADAKAGASPYLFGVLFDWAHRRELLLHGARHILKPFLVGVVVDLITQYFIFQRVRLAAALLVGLLLVGLPYSVSRGLTNRIATHWK